MLKKDLRNSPASRLLRTATFLVATGGAIAVPALLAPGFAAAETTLRIGMTAADIPRTLGQPDRGFEGNRFTGLTMYDALVL